MAKVRHINTLEGFLEFMEGECPSIEVLAMDRGYDSEGRLVFTFLHPVKLVPADNEYGVSLKNAVILLDPGHTGTVESGAVHSLYGKSSAYGVTEAAACLTMCKEVKSQLEKLGATVYLTRTTNDLTEKLTLEDRAKMIRKLKPDLFISIHHNYLL